MRAYLTGPNADDVAFDNFMGRRLPWVIAVVVALSMLVDATIVRLVLVPAAMGLLGNANWWIPSWLGQVLPRASEAGRERRPVPERRPADDRAAPGADGGRGPMATGTKS
jgi:hypothetical protein